ncbi:MAG TPA: SCO family protein [Steroidobacteraceae bacterium]
MTVHPRVMMLGTRAVLLVLIMSPLLPRSIVAAEFASGALFDALPSQWRDDAGVSFDLRDLRGQPVISTMAYTGCHRICPMTIHRLQLLQRQLDESGVDAQFVVVGYDPEADDVAAWHRYRLSRGLTRANWHFLVGSPESVTQFARILGFPFWKVDEHVMHESRIVYFDGRGGVLVDPKLDALIRRPSRDFIPSAFQGE